MNPQQWDIQLCRLLNSPSFAGLHAPKTLTGSATDEMWKHVPTCRQNSFVRVIGYLSKKSISQIKTKLLPQTENPGRIPLSASASNNNNADGLPNLLEDKLARLLLLKSRDQASRVYCLKKRCAV